MSRITAIAVIGSLLLAGLVAFSAGSATAAVSPYPSWDDVARARMSEDTASRQVTAIQATLKALTNDAAVKNAESIALGDALFEAQAKVDSANVEVAAKEMVVKQAKARADESSQVAGRIASKSMRSVGPNLSAKLFFSGEDSRTLLHELALDSKLTDQVKLVYEKAFQDRNTAKALTAQAKTIRDSAQSLSEAAAAALHEAQAAADSAQVAVDESNAHSARLAAQVDALRSRRQITEAEFKQSVPAPVVTTPANQIFSGGKPSKPPVPPKPWEEPAAQPASPSPSPSPTAWVRPAVGNISSGFGLRASPCAGCSSSHAGLDFAASCNSPIVAASAGTVEFAGRFGGYGNFVRIKHSDGLTTGYGHIVDGGIQVRNGQQVTAGQQIALVGSTGASTGCHLHFETRTNGIAEDPAPFLRARGVSV